jgi:hypothetical protein
MPWSGGSDTENVEYRRYRARQRAMPWFIVGGCGFLMAILIFVYGVYRTLHCVDSDPSNCDPRVYFVLIGLSLIVGVSGTLVGAFKNGTG